MLYIVMAFYAEAAPLIEAMQLKRSKEETVYDTFQDENRDVVLILTGVGKLQAAVAVSHICTKYRLGKEDFLLHIGSAAGAEIGNVYVINRIQDKETKHFYYPDVLFRHELPECGVVTVGRPLDDGVPEGGCLYDMEAVGVYQGCVPYLGQHQMAFLKVASDAGEAAGMTAEKLREIIGKRVPDILQVVETIRIFMESQKSEQPDDEELRWRKQLYEDMRCSETMRLQTEQLLRYLWLAGVEYHALIEEDYHGAKLPCKDRREGKKYLERLKKQLL